MIKLLQQICHLLEEGEDLVLATIIDHSGSTPRSVGTRMVVRPEGAIVGTIGGGLVEFETRKAASEVFRNGAALLKTIELQGADAATTDQMICGGRLEILLEMIIADPENIGELKQLITFLQKSHKGFLITALENAGGRTIRRMPWCLVQEGGVVFGSFPGDESWIADLTGEDLRAKRPLAVPAGGKRFFVEPMVLPATVFLFGAGHVSRPVAELASMVDFRTVVLDDRAEYANRERFPNAEEVRVVPSFQSAFGGLEIDRDSYLVILTRGHLHDKTVLEPALRTEAGYIGMIGSRRKRDLIFQELLSKGFKQSDLDRVHAPIGLAIGAETPEEIAVSIVAELIRVRADKDK